MIPVPLPICAFSPVCSILWSLSRSFTAYGFHEGQIQTRQNPDPYRPARQFKRDRTQGLRGLARETRLLRDRRDPGPGRPRGARRKKDLRVHGGNHDRQNP